MVDTVQFAMGPAPNTSWPGGSNGIAQRFAATVTAQVNKLTVSFLTAPAAGTYQVGVASVLGAPPTWVNGDAFFNVINPGAGDVTVTFPSLVTLNSATTYFAVVYRASPGEVAGAGYYNNVGTPTNCVQGPVFYGTNFGSQLNSQTFPFSLLSGTPTPPPAPILTVTAQPALGNVRLGAGVITPPAFITASAPPLSYIVRGSTSLTSVGFVLDWDAPLNTEISYTLTDQTGTSAPKTVTLVSSEFWLNSMRNPDLNAVQPVVLRDEEQSWEGRGVAHDVLNTPAPLVTTQVLGYRAGTFVFYAKTVADWVDLRDLLGTGDVMLLRSPCQSEVLDTAFLLTRAGVELNWDNPPKRTRTVEVEYRAVRRDTGPPAEVAWSFNDVKATYASFNALPTRFASFDELTLGPDPVPVTAGALAALLAEGEVEALADPGVELGW